MTHDTPHSDNASNHSRTVIPSENGGSVRRSKRERRPLNEHGGAAPTAVRVSRTAVAVPDVRPLPLCNGWTRRHAEKLKRDEHWHRTQGTRNGKPWTLEADRFTRAVLAECPPRALTPETATEYRRVCARLAREGVTAWDKANSAQHWNKLRTACRWAMAEDIRTWREASEQARKAGDLERAQACTAEAWRLAVALDEQFLKHGHDGWASKAAAMKVEGRKPVDKSKRRTNAPTADMAPCALLDTRHRGERLAARHSERLALLALTGCRPAELMAGVELTLIRDKQGQPNGLGVTIHGAKVDAQRGHALRRLVFPLADGGTAVRGLALQCAEHGGRYTLATTPADYRSLNRALQAHGLSCYAFRHGVGSDLKGDIADGKATPEHAAKVMGHRSTASLLSYGTRRRGRGGQRPRAGVSGVVKVDSVTRAARARARAEKKKAKAKADLVGAAPAPERLIPQTPLARGLRPPFR